MVTFYLSVASSPQAFLRRHVGWILLAFFILTATFSRAQNVQLQFNSVVNVGNVSNVASCSAFSVDMSYGVVSPTTSAFGATIYVPLKGLSYISLIGSPDVSTAVVRGTSPNDTLVVVMKSPLAAGSAGNISANLQYPCGTTCSGVVATVQPFFDATNAAGRASTSPVSLTARSVDPGYQINVVPTSYNAATRRGTHTVRITPTTSPANFLALTTPVVSLTVPANVVIQAAGTTGTRSNIPNNLPSGTFTPTSTTGTTTGGAKTIRWTNLPTFFRGGSFDVSNVILEYPVASYPSGSTVTLTSGFSGTLASSTSCGTAEGTRPYALTIIDPNPGATGCSGQTMLFGLNNPWNAVFTGKANQSRITVPFTNTGNVPLTNVVYTINIPTNELAATQVYASGSNGVTGQAYFQTNLNSTYQLLGSVGQGTANRSFTLINGEYVTRVQVVAATINVGNNMSVSVQTSQLSPLRSGSAVNAAPLANFMSPTANQTQCFGGYTCMTTSATISAEYSGTTVINQSCTSSRVVVQPTSGVQNFQKALPVTSPSYVPGQVYQYRIRFGPVTAGDTLRNLVITDVLPNTLEYVGNLKYSNTTTPPATGSGTFTSGTSLPQFSQTGQTLTWSWAALPSPNSKIVSTADHYLYFNVRIRSGAPVGTLQNCASITGTGMYTVANACVNLTVNSLAKVDAIKWVRGDLDRNYTRYPNIGHTTDGGKSDYRFVLVNSGNVAFKNIVLIDIFPWIGDQIVAADYTRDSEWRPRMLQAVRFYAKAAADSSRLTSTTIAAPANLTVSYSTQTNPCRSEFSPPYNPNGCVVNSWTATPPTDLSTVQAIKLNIAGPFAAGDTLVFGVEMRSPVGTLLNAVAWNSFGYQAARNDNSALLPVAEPNKVGIDVKRFPAIGNYAWQDLNGNGRQDEPPTAGVNGLSVQLWSPGGDGERGTSDDFLVGTKLTANDPQGRPGYYRFDSLFAETYYLRFTPPIGQAFTRQLAATVPDSLNSDPDGRTGWTNLTLLEPNEQDFSWDAGLCTIPNAGPDYVFCAPTTSVNLPDATGFQSWTALDNNPPGASIDPQTGQVSGLSGGLYRFVLTAGGGCTDTVLVTVNAFSLTVAAGTCQANGTQTRTTDDYYQPLVRATYAAPGASGRYVVVLNANADGTGGTVLNTGGTPYGEAVAVGTPGQFPADNTTMYRLVIRDQDVPGCFATTLSPSVPPCSSCGPPSCAAPRLQRL